MPESSGLLTSKIGPQGRGKRNVARARLVALLESAPEARLVLVSAPAGFGKSRPSRFAEVAEKTGMSAHTVPYYERIRPDRRGSRVARWLAVD